MVRRLFLIVILVAIMSYIPNDEATIEKPKKPESNTEEVFTCDEEDCCFCDGHELSNKERCEELLVKMLTDEKNWLDDGLISKEVYELQIEPVNKALDYLEIASEEEVDILYKEVLLLNSDWLESDIEAGEEIDEGFYQYIEEELKRID